MIKIKEKNIVCVRSQTQQVTLSVFLRGLLKYLPKKLVMTQTHQKINMFVNLHICGIYLSCHLNLSITP